MSGTEGRVLVLGDYPLAYGNGIGETLTNLLHEVPHDRIYQAYPSHLGPPSANRDRVLAFEWPRPPSGVPSLPYFPVLKVRQVAAERALYRDAAALIEREAIDAVLTYPVTPWVLSAAVQLRRRFPKVRFVFYVMDDWEGHHKCFGLPFTARRRAILREMVDTADVRFACSYRMKADYEQQFGNAWGVMHKGVAIVPLPAMNPMRRPWNIFYAGGMNVFRADAVIAFCEGLQRFRQQSGQAVTLTLLGAGPNSESIPELAPFDFVRVEPWVGQEECRRRMAGADLLYLPLSMQAKLDRIANLAMPTKFSEYLAAARPVIFHVPAESEVRDLAAGAGLPLIITTNAPDAICGQLLSIERDGIDLSAYRDRAWRLLRDEFDENALRARLQSALFPTR